VRECVTFCMPLDDNACALEIMDSVEEWQPYIDDEKSSIV